MKRFLKLGMWGFLGLSGILALAAGYVYFALPRVAATTPDVHAATSGSDLERGRYLAENVAICLDCHSSRDFGRFTGPLQRNTLGQGGEVFGHAQGFPGELVAQNITPDAKTGVGSWSDAQLAQAITAGVTPDGRALFPFMNYPGYAQMCRSDLEALLGFLRSLPAIEHKVAPTRLDFPVNLLVRTMPQAAQLREDCPGAAADSVKRGEYLVTLAGCSECHTRHEQGKPVAGQEFAGGEAFPMPSGFVARSANITPDPETGIGRWNKTQFVQRFAAFRDLAALAKVGPGQANTPMPWTQFAGMTDEDLGSIYDYLRTLPAVKVREIRAVAVR